MRDGQLSQTLKRFVNCRINYHVKSLLPPVVLKPLTNGLDIYDLMF